MVAEPVPVPRTPIDTIADDVARLRADGSAIERLDSRYLMRREPGGWKLAVAVACAAGWEHG